MLKIINVVGARPNFMKIAPLVSAMRSEDAVEQVLVHTGQHYDANMAKVFFADLGIPTPDIDLGVGSGTRDEQIALIIERFVPVLLRECPQLVLVVGDVNSTVACARAAKKHGVLVAHVEAGLRSFDLSMPEEHNRTETDRLSDYLFVTERSGIENLKEEGVDGKVFLVGNVMIDTLVANLAKAGESQILRQLNLRPGEYFLATFHRPSNVDSRENLENLVEIVSDLASRLPFVLPLHPRTRKSLEHYGLFRDFRETSGLVITDPLGYLDFLRLLLTARAVITDSGGIQEETTYLGIPCLTMRENTERPVTIEVGTNVLVGSSRERLYSEIERILGCKKTEVRVPEFWDGRTAPRIVEILKNELL